MDQQDGLGSLQPPPPPPTTENPVKAAAHRVKAALSSNQQPSVRIRRETPALLSGEPNHVPAPKDLSFSEKIRSLFRREESTTNDESYEREYDQDTVDILDVVDPEVSTLSTLTNVQNSLFVPQLGKLVNRRPAYRVTPGYGEASTIDKLKASLKRIKSLLKDGKDSEKASGPLSNAQYAVLPEGETLQGWSREEKEELDDLVRHMLHSRRARFKRSMKGFWQYVRRPFGLFITVYATLITLFGAAWVFFLIGWISLGSRESYIVNVVDNVLVALFAIIGDGLAPFRAVDTYHMIYIAYYHRKTHKIRGKLGLPELVDRNDLPEQRKEEAEPATVDIESLIARRMPPRLARMVAPRIPKRYADRMVARSTTEDPPHEYTVLTDEELAKLEYHERKFSKSHTFYKPHETETHYAFPLKLLVTVVLLLDLHSCLQISLGACTWGINYKTRPFALTTVILCCSITCNIMGGVLISVGDKKTRKQDVVERMMRQELTAEAIEQIRTRQLKDAEERGVIDPSVRKRLEEEKDAAENEEIKKSWKSVPSLPKKLLGKGEDHRQEPLPQKARRSSTSVDASSSSTPKKGKSGSNTGLPLVQEDKELPSHPEPVRNIGEKPPKEGVGQKALRYIRKADLDRS